jgi:hypothetical protein
MFDCSVVMQEFDVFYLDRSHLKTQKLDVAYESNLGNVSQLSFELARAHAFRRIKTNRDGLSKTVWANQEHMEIPRRVRASSAQRESTTRVTWRARSPITIARPHNTRHVPSRRSSSVPRRRAHHRVSGPTCQ